MGLLIFSIILAIILRIYGPTIKGYFGEKSVSFFLSRLDPGKYKVINNIMLKIDGRTSQDRSCCRFELRNFCDRNKELQWMDFGKRV
jgi:hypothetical protein